MVPQVDYVVFVISSVEVDVTRVDEQERKQDDEDLDRVFSSIHKVAVKQIGLLQRRHPVLWQSIRGLKVRKHTPLI